MKIEGPSKPQATEKTKKAGKSSKTSETESSFEAFVASGPKEAAPAAAAQSIAKIDVLLAVQGTEDPAQGAARKRMQMRAQSVLKELEKIRISLLAGNMTVGHVIDIADVIASHRERISDPGLVSILDEIDLRAQIEIAKMRKALDSRAKA